MLKWTFLYDKRTLLKLKKKEKGVGQKGWKINIPKINLKNSKIKVGNDYE